MTIISGNIEAWIGLSATHAYLFLERVYDALVEAELLTPIGRGRISAAEAPSSLAAGGRHRTRTNSGRWWARFGLLIISILTKLKVELVNVLNKLAQLFWCRSSSIRQTMG